ncbi:hypothetical protein L596_028981 [Steinernema carpocapsae]|uniref:HMG box domain-containing protein n=1 Tax=Steinernema carpocapsae TaxID=34508 RepID=A0A4U5LTA2_STECR|nr:hypothetical protein L596_028981 [Steinernema carpocapsae]
MKMSLSPDPQGTVDEDETKVFREDDDEIRDEDETKVFKEEEDDEVEDEVSTLEADTVNSDNQEVAKETEHLGRSFMPPNFAAAMANMANLMNSPVYQAMRTQAMISPMFMPIQNPYGMMSPVLAAAASPSFGYAPQLLQGIAPHIPFGQYPQHLLQCRNPLTPSAQNTPRRQARRAEERIKKPLNSFMLYMKCNRKKMLEENAEYRKMQSAELNKVMGENWQKLTPEERNVYEDMAKKEQENHKLKYPNWTARDNYAVHKRRTRRDRVEDNSSDTKKCRARFGMDNQKEWCKHCLRKKRCLFVGRRDQTSPLVSSTTHHEGLLNPLHAMNLHRQPTESPMSSRSVTSATSSATGSLSHPNSVHSEVHDDSEDDEEMSDGEGDETLTEPENLSQNQASPQVPLQHPQPQMPHPMAQMPQFSPFGMLPPFANLFHPYSMAQAQQQPPPQNAVEPRKYENL